MHLGCGFRQPNSETEFGASVMVTPPYGSNTGGAQRRADVPKAWLPPTKFRAEIWGVSHRHRPLRKAGKPHRPPGPAAQSGASAARMGGRGGDRGRDHPQISSNLGQSLSHPAGDSSRCTREPFPAGGRGSGRTHRSAPTRSSECPAMPDGAGQSPPFTGAPGVPVCGPMYRRHGPCRPNFVPKFGASVIGLGPYERTGIRIFTSTAGPQLPIPRDSGKVSKGRAAALPLVVGGVWGWK